MMTPAPIVGTKFVLKRQLMKLVGSNFRIYDTAGQFCFLAHQKGFKLKEDIRIFRDEGMTQEVFRIAARQVMDFSGVYDVVESSTGAVLGSFKRKGWNSIARDEWEVWDAQGRPIGRLFEDNILLALLRRLATNLIPQNYDLTMHDGQRVADYYQNFNPFTYHLNLDFTGDPQAQLDRRVGIAAAVLLAAIEGRQG